MEINSKLPTVKAGPDFEILLLDIRHYRLDIRYSIFDIRRFDRAKGDPFSLVEFSNDEPRLSNVDQSNFEVKRSVSGGPSKPGLIFRLNQEF